ncbi:hypothetical protein IE81DRAFT_326648 [Ceraceosorus guamensis]|uniref:Glutamate--cysteine ligase modifier subunit n=1 Tax=Ceraceosorus guamensis TaxID=1522189 RepID=A0A316VT14_9BASI|nr:hypothetical protein IE81DRAFT_326648 [Ceraceosorus guamensis]PWN39351.1 hypothetical protein IE81DRAFT_326648 [Ceraceosorus guamensis]
MTSHNSSSSCSSAYPTTLVLHTHDASRPLKPSSYGALSHALHETLHFALDGNIEDWALDTRPRRAPCGPAEEFHISQATPSVSTSSTAPAGPSSSSSSLVVPTSNSNGAQESDVKPRPGFVRPPTSLEEDREYISYATSSIKSHHSSSPSTRLWLPHPSSIAADRSPDPCAAGGSRDALDVTAKFFCLGKDPQNAPEYGTSGVGQWFQEALDALSSSTGILTVDQVILEFPRLKLGGQEASGDEEVVKKTWQHLSGHPQLSALGLSSVSLPALRAVFPDIDALSSRGGQGTQNGDARHDDSTAELKRFQTIPSACRHPKVITIDLSAMRSPCAWDKELGKWCADRGIELSSANDGNNILPDETLPTLLTEFEDSFPVPWPKGATLVPRWCLKYTILIRDRGVIADQSWILLCDVLAPSGETKER